METSLLNSRILFLKNNLNDFKYNIIFSPDLDYKHSDDIDIVFFNVNAKDITKSLTLLGHKIEGNSFIINAPNDSFRLDFYINCVNCGYYKIINLSFKDKIFVDISDYCVVQLLEPLIKFSEYKKRHIGRLKYFKDNGILDNQLISKKLKFIIGFYFTVVLLKNTRTSFSGIFIKFLKLRLLFANGNLLRMFKSRFLS